MKEVGLWRDVISLARQRTLAGQAPGLAIEQPEEWVNEHGETKRASRQHQRRGVWTLTESGWPTWRACHQQDPNMTPEEFWIRMLPASVLDKVCFLLGPMNRQDQQLQMLARGVFLKDAGEIRMCSQTR